MVQSKEEAGTLAEGPGQRAHRRVGTMIRDKYRIDAFIATGSMANVYAATHRNGSRVALKVLHRELTRETSLAERFRREGYFANSIGHPGVVRAIDDDVTEDGCAFIVLELLDGENLEERRVRLGGRIPLPDVLTVADAMLDVLAAAHAHEVLHRDVKPDNVFITRKNEVKLLDFGVARFNDGRSSSDMTGVGMVLGTPAFMPPEQALGRREEVDARSDIWGVGATLFTVITGESVHDGDSAKAKLIATARKPARPLRQVAPDTPRAVAAVIDRALAFDRAERWADAKAMREALRWARRAVDGEAPPADEPDGAPVETRRAPDDLVTTVVAREEFDEDTAKRLPALVRPAIRRRTKSISDGVYTSAPPVTRRDEPPSMEEVEDPTFSLRNDPVFSLRKNSDPPAQRPAAEPMPETQRVPRNASIPPAAEAPEVDDGRITRPRAQPADDTSEIFQAALAAAQRHDGIDLATLPRFDPKAAMEAPPRPAAGAPPEIPKPESSRPIRTTPGLGGPDLLRASQHPPPQREWRADETQQMPSAPLLPHPAHLGAVSAVHTAEHAASSYRPPSPEHYGQPPPERYGPSGLPPGREPMPSFASAPYPSVVTHPSLPPENPGPLLSTIVPKRTRAITVAIPIALLLAGLTAYVVVGRQRAARPSHVTAAVATAAPAASSAAAPAPSAASAASSIASEATPPPSALPQATASASASGAAVAPRPRPRPRPRPKPAAPSSATTSTTPAEPPTAEPAPAPAPAPAPTESDTLPRKEE